MTAGAQARERLTFSPWDGLYVAASVGGAGTHPPASLVRTLTQGVSIAVGRDVTTSTTPAPGGGWTFQMPEGKRTYVLTLNPPEHDALPWRIVGDGMNVDYTLRVGELEALVRSRLAVGARFIRLDRDRLTAGALLDDATTRDAITVMEHGLVRIERPDGNGLCAIDALIPALDRVSKPLPSPLPAEGALGAVSYTLGTVDEGCRGRALDRQARGIDGGMRLLADGSGSVVGALVIGERDPELFVAPHTARADLERLDRAARLPD